MHEAALKDRETLRRRLRAQRAALSDVDVRAASQAVCAHLAALPAFARARTVASYVATQGEIDPAALFEPLRQRGAAVAFPRVEREVPPTLSFRLVAEPSELGPGRFAIAAPPQAAPEAAAGSIDVVLVPAVAFARDGHRLGFGRGFYDAALHAIPTALRIGLCHPFQLIDALPPRDGDEPVDLLLTPHGPLATSARTGFAPKEVLS